MIVASILISQEIQAERLAGEWRLTRSPRQLLSCGSLVSRSAPVLTVRQAPDQSPPLTANLRPLIYGRFAAQPACDCRGASLDYTQKQRLLYPNPNHKSTSPMIIDGRTNLFTLLKGNVYSIVGVVVVIILAELADIQDLINLQRPVFEAAALGLLATALSIFLVFRVNEAYARWWEARTLWGGLVNSSRSFARQATTLIGSNPDQREVSRALQQEFVYRQIAYVNALRMSLRREEDWKLLDRFLPAGELALLEKTSNKPAQLLQTQGERLGDIREAGLLDGFGHRMLDSTLSDLCNYQGGCERIKNTIFPDRVAYFTRAVAWLLAILIPICVVAASEEITWIELVVIPIMVLVFIFTVKLGNELKNPFENKPNDTPMTALCRTIEIDLRQQLGEEEVPAPVQPVDGILL